MTSNQPSSSFSTPSTSSSALCSQCELVPSKYTCPACSFKTCSLVCSKLHKSSAPCTGIRNPAVYVPMNAYAYPTMVSDYTFLAGVGRKVDELGRDIASNSKGKGRANAPGGNAGGNGKLDALRREMVKKGLGGVTFLSEGMERRRLNETRWQAKNQVLFMTVSLNYHATLPSEDPSPMATDSTQSTPADVLPEPVLITIHSMSSTTTLATLLSKHPSTKGLDATQSHVFLLPHPTSTRAQPAYYTPPLTSLSSSDDSPAVADQNSSASIPISASDVTLEAFLQGKSWIEWPTISILPLSVYDDLKSTLTLIDAAVPTLSLNPFTPEADLNVDEQGGPRKKMRVWGEKTVVEGDAVMADRSSPEQNERTVQAAIEEMITGMGGEADLREGVLPIGGLDSLLGGYGSDEDSDEDEN